MEEIQSNTQHKQKRTKNKNEYYYKGEKRTECLTELLADLLEEEEHPAIEENMDLFIEMCQKNELPKDITQKT